MIPGANFLLSINLLFSVDSEYVFCTKIYYPDGELELLKGKLSDAEHRRLFCHIAFFEGLKFLVTFPAQYDISLIADGLGPESLALFREIAGSTF